MIQKPPDGVFLDDRFLVVDVETTVRYLSGRQFARAVRVIKRVARPREGETTAQWVAGLVDTGQLELDALIITSQFSPGEPLGEIHYCRLDKRDKPSS